MNWLEQVLGSEWKITPAGGATGDAYFAKRDGQELFLKRNSSPFLAVLSAEGIVPKLVWTKRMENGDVITAQHRLIGRELKPIDMNGSNVAELLQKIHHSKELLDMLKRLGKQPLTPNSIIEDIQQAVAFEKLEQPEINQAIELLVRQLPDVQCDEQVVCHCDVNHNNWLLSETDQLYLIDWDGAMIADPAIDIGILLYWYIDEADWKEWLSSYGLELNERLKTRIYWYVLLQALTSFLWYHAKDNEKDKQNWIDHIKMIRIKMNSN
ncbi:phosphotransferase family protein [Metabacillus elymi]|uniref:Phosphotransferase family protein n=1 Tax=Metabacillus elymi TaxID=2745198 RepID=A0ABX6RY50_9BACI|nr:phosphotransferase family protein [Metabacillus sp. KUDC1714]QNF26539.1 phosphotransferase family protein [Metabacillus sp. KUDC1714]